MKRSLFFLITLATLLVLAACVAPTQPAPATPTAEVPPAPEPSTTEPESSGGSDEAEIALDEQEAVTGEDASSTDEAAREENEGAQTSMATSPLSTESGSFEIVQLAQINPPPQLSQRALGVSVVPCADSGIRGPAGVEGETYYCGIFTVPQNWNDPDGRNLDLTFVVAKATGEDPRPDPLIFLAGGPGQSAVVTPVSTYDKLRPAHDIVRLDQRGTGYSQRLGWEECLVLAAQDSDPGPGLDALQAIVFPPEEFAIGGDSESPLSDAQAVAQVNQLCWDQFTGQGIDLNQFDTAASARDVIELIKALGYDSFNIHGVSYGTRLAMTIMDDLSDAADAPTLRSVVLDSTFPPSIYMLSSLPRNEHDLVLQLLDDCRQDDLCREAYPNLAGRLGLLLDRLAEEPLSVDGETVTAHDLVRELGDLGSRRAGFMPKLVAELEKGVLDTYLGLRNGELGSGFPEGVPGLDRSDPVQAFIGNAVALIGGNDDLGVMFDFITSVGDTLATDDSQGALQGFIEGNYTGDTGDQLLAWLAALTPEDFSRSPYVAQAQGSMMPEEDAPEPDPEAQAKAERIQQRTLAALGFAQPLFNAIHCSEDIQFERIEDAVNSFNDLEYPEFSSIVLSQNQIDACQNWPVETAPIQVKNPVSSSVPALILQGAYDTRTPVYMGKRAARELENSTFVLVPQQGHEVWTSAGSCAANIAAAFVMNPDQEVDQSCLDLRRPQWALPEADASLDAPEETPADKRDVESPAAANEGV